MANNKMLKIILGTILLNLVLVVGYCYAPSTSFEKEVLAISKYNVSNNKTTTIKQVTYTGGFSTSGKQVTYEEFRKDRELLALETGIIPWLKYPREKDKNQGDDKARLDATLETWESSLIPKETEVRKLTNNRIKLFVQSYKYDNQTSDPNIPNPYGTEGAFVATSRTIVQYKNAGITNLTQGESYILAHTKDTGFDISKVQYAMYLYKNNGAEPTTEYLGFNPESKILGKALYEEAKMMDQYANSNNEITSSNGGRELIDNMASKYSSGEAGIVSYTEEKDEFLVGPFSVNYARKVVQPITGGNSETIEKDGTVVYGGIVGAKLYGIKNNREVELTDWDFIYPDVTYNAASGTVKRDAIAQAGQRGDIDKSIYPLPNEVFYIKIPNGAVDAISRIEFTMQSLKASGTANKLTGTYEDVNYYVRGNKSVVETKPASSKPVYGWVTYYSTETVYENDMSKPIKDAQGNIIGYEKKPVQVQRKEDRWEIIRYDPVPAEYSYSYEFYIEGVGTTKRAPNAYKVVNAKIYKEEKNVSINLGQYHSKYSSTCIPLTMDIAGIVWYDGTEVDQVNKQTNMIKDAGEAGVSGVTVNLYEIAGSGTKLIETKTTGADGKYKFEYVKAGRKYYVEFIYDGMKYKSVHPLYSSGQIQLGDYYQNPENWLNHGHGAELESDRINFNNRFYEITTNTGISQNGNKTDMSYTYTNSELGQIATVQAFNINASTKTYNIIYPLHKNYAITNKSNSVLINSDKNLGQSDANKITIGKSTNREKYYCAQTNVNDNNMGSNVYMGNEFFKAYDYLTNINLGLIERTPADFGLKFDATQTVFTLNEIISNANISNFGEKSSEYYSDFDIYERTEGYYNKTYTQSINNEEYTWRHDFVDKQELLENDELQLYVQYKITILNQSELLKGCITELTNYYDKEYYYPVDSNETWKYYDKDTNYLESEKGYANVTIPKLMEHSSWAIKNNGTQYKQNLGQVEWNSTSKYGDNNDTNLNKMYTRSLEGVDLQPNETIDVFIIFKVERSENSEYGYGKYIINDNTDVGKRAITEINGYRAYNINGTAGGRVDKDSNPGNVNIKDTTSYEDDVDLAPYIRVIVNDSSNGKGITGHVWQDQRTETDKVTNQLMGNGKKDENEDSVNNVKVELVRLEYNKTTGAYDEVNFTDKYLEYAKKNDIKIYRYTGPQENEIDSKYTIERGQYRFTNVIESGKYKVRFTYGTEEQFNNTSNLDKISDSLKYNGHDYKSTEYPGLINTTNDITALPSLLDNPSTKVIFILDNSDSVTNEDKKQIEEVTTSISSRLKQTHKMIETEKITMTNDNAYSILQQTINSLDKIDYANEVIVMITDGAISNKNKTKEMIQSALGKQITVIGIGINGADEQLFKAKVGENESLYYNLRNNEQGVYYTVNSVYNRVIDNIISNTLLQTELSHSTDYLEDGFITTTGVKVDGRVNVMKNSQVINSQKAHELDVEYIAQLKRDSEEWENMTEVLAENTQMTADSYAVSVNFDDVDGKVKTLNLGLQEIPKSEVEVENKVVDIVLQLSNGEKIVAYRNGLKENLHIFPNDRYIIYLDEEIIHGSTIEVEYEIFVNNIGEVDNLWTYLKYYPDSVKAEIYNKLTGKQITEGTIYETLLSTIPITINNMYDHYDNLQFSEQKNNRMLIINRLIDVKYDKNNLATIQRDKNTNNIIYIEQENILNSARQEVTTWEIVDKKEIKERETLLNDEVRETVARYNTIKTTSLKEIELYPIQSKEVQDKAETSSVSTYVRLSKIIAANDLNINSMLDYKNFVEIIETQSIRGRRDYDSKVGNYKPNTEIQEKDTAKAELVQILPPFGAKIKYYALAGVTLVIIAGGIILIKRKILDNKN